MVSSALRIILDVIVNKGFYLTLMPKSLLVSSFSFKKKS